MRKEFVYSFMALGAIPVVVNAADVVTKDAMVVTDQGQDVAIGELVPGKYTFKTDAIVKQFSEGVLTVTGLPGVDAKTFKDGDKISIDFEVKETTTVTVNLKADYEVKFNVPQQVVVLNFSKEEFKAKVAELEKKYNEALAIVGSYAENDKNAKILEALHAIGVEIEKIGTTETYENYKNSELWKDPSESAALQKLDAGIEEAKADAAAAEVEFQAGELQKTYDALIADFNKNVTSQAGKDLVNNDKDASPAKVQDAINAYKAGTDPDKTAVDALINTLKANIEKAKALDGGNNSAYQAVVDKVKAATDAFTAANERIQKVLPKDKDDSETLRSEGVKALTSQFDIINKVSSDNEASKAAGTCEKDKDGYIKQLEDAIAELDAVATQYEGFAAILDAAHDIVNTNQEKLDKYAEEKKDAIANDADVAKDKDAAQKLIDDLKKKIADNANTENIEKNLTNLTEDASKINEAIEKLLSGDNILNYEAFARVKAEYDNLLKTITDNYAGYKKLSEKDDTYDVASFWDGWFTNVTANFNFPEVLKAINKAYKDKKAVDFEKNTFPGKKSDLENYINELKTKAPGAYEAYTNIKKATDTYQKNLDDLTAKVKDLDIYEKGTDAGVLPYKDQIADIQKRIKKITDDIAAAMKLKDAKHYDAMTAIKDDPSIQSDIDALLKNYEADQAAWEKEQADKAIQALQAAINELAGDVEKLAKDIDDLDCGDNEADINKKNSEIKDKVLPLPTLDGKTQQELDEIVTNLNKAKDDLTKLKEEAQAAADNQVAYAAMTKLYDTVAADLEQAKKDAVAADAAAGDTYYKQQVLEKTYADELAALKKEIDKLNKKGAVDKQENLTNKLKDLQTRIKAVKSEAKENLDQKKKQDEEMAKAEKLWNEVFTEISKTDESSLLPTLQEELSGYKQELNDIKAQIPGDYEKGLARTNGLLAKIQDLEKKINDVKAKSKDGYDERIAQDNADTKAAIDAAIKDARQAFTDAAETVEQYKGFQSDLLKNATEKVKATTDPLVDVLYEQPDEISKLETEIGDTYTATETPAVFDKDGKLMGKVQAKIDEIKKYEEDYVTAIMDAVHADCDALVADYKAQRDAAATVVKGFNKDWKDSDINDFFKDIDKLVSDIETAITNQDLSELDKALTAAKDFTKKVADVKEAKAEEILGAALKKVNTESNYLDDADKKALGNLNNDYSKKKTNDQLADNFNDLKASIEALQKEIDAKKAELLNYDEISQALDDIQDKIDAARELLEDYIVASQVEKEYIDVIQSNLNSYRETLESDKKDGTVTYWKSWYDNQIKNLETYIQNAITVNLYDTEYDKLKELVVNDLEAAYVLLANDFETPGVQELAAECKKQIEELRAALAKDDVDKTKLAAKDKKPEKLLPLEKDITTLLTKMSQENNPQAVAVALQKLNDQVETLNSDIEQDPSNFTEEQQADIAAQQEAINNAIAALKEQIESKKDQILPYVDIIQGQIDDVKKAIEALQADAEAYQKEYDDKVKAAEKLNADIAAGFEAIEKAIQDAKDEIADLGQAPEDFKAKFELVEGNLATLKDEIEAKNGVTEAKDLTKVNDLKASTDETLADVLNTAAKRQLKAELADLQDQAKAISFNEDDYTIADNDKLNKQLDAVNTSISDLSDAIDTTKDYYGGLNGALGKDIEDIQKAIDELNKAIEDLKLVPEEPTPEPVVVPGNITGDDSGVVDGADLDLFLEKLLNNELPATGDENFEVYDVNGDGKITIADAQGIANLSAGLNWDGSLKDEAPARASEQPTAAYATAKEQLAGGITRLYFQLSSNTALTGFQMDVVGGRVVAEGAEGLTLRSAELENGAHRIVSFGETIENGMMLYVDVEGDAQFANVVFTTAGAHSLTLSGTANAIAGIEAGSQEGTRFDLSGRIVNGMKKGVNIIRDAYGNVKKVFVK